MHLATIYRPDGTASTGKFEVADKDTQVPLHIESAIVRDSALDVY